MAHLEFKWPIRRQVIDTLLRHLNCDDLTFESYIIFGTVSLLIRRPLPLFKVDPSFSQLKTMDGVFFLFQQKRLHTEYVDDCAVWSVCVYSSIIIIIIVMAMCVSRPQRCAAFFGWSWRPGHSFKLPSTFFFLPFLLLLYIIFPLFFFFLFVSLPCSYTRPLYLAHSLAHSIWSLKLNATTISLLRSSFMPTLTLLVFSSLSRRSLRLQPNSFHILPSLSLFLIS